MPLTSLGLGEQRVAVPADDHVHAPLGPQHGGQLLVGLEADVGEEDGQVDVVVLEGVADLAHLRARLLQGDEGADELVHLEGVHDLLGEDAGEEDVEAGLLDDVVGAHHALLEGLDVEVGVDDGEVGDLLQEEQVGQAVVHLVVAQGHHVGRQVVHDLHGGGALEVGVDDRPLHHVARDHVEDVLLLGAHLVDVAGEKRQSADELPASRRLLGQEVPVHVVGVEDGELARGAHLYLPSDIGQVWPVRPARLVRPARP